MVLLQGWSDKMSVEVDDVKRVLAICFRDGSTQTIDDLERILSFDMGWMDTDSAHQAINSLIIAGWIVNNDGNLSPNCELKGINAPLGWQPRPSRLIEPVVNQSPGIPVKIIDKTTIIEDDNTSKPVNKDPRSRLEKRLIKYISKQSGIERDEVERRAERKVKALNYCTTWMALCLVSREQNLEMNSIIDSLSAS